MVIGQLTPLEETQAGKELIALGVEKGILIGKIQSFQKWLGDSVLSWETLKSESLESLQANYESLEARMPKNP